MSSLKFLVSVCVCALLVLPAGCGPKGPAMVPVSGVVKLDGVPVGAGAGVTFIPVGAGRPATGETDKDGKFTLTTEKANDGALEGEYSVAVAGVRTVGAKANDDGTSGDVSQVRQEWFVPQKYSNQATSDLRQTVSKDMKSVELNLSAK
jgi:hypothetical protein